MSFVSFKAVRFILGRYFASSWFTRRSRSRAAFAVMMPMLGVAVGVGAFVVILSVMGGFVRNLKSKLLSLEPHIEVISTGSSSLFDANPTLLDAVRHSSSDIVAVSPFLRGDATLQSPARIATVSLLGIDSGNADNRAQFADVLTRKDLSLVGRELRSSEPEGGEFPGIAVGSVLLFQIGAEAGDRLTLVSAVPEEGPGGLAPRQFPVIVADALRSGNPAFDSKLVLGSLDFVSAFLGAEGAWSGLRVGVRDPLNADRVIADVEKTVRPFGLRAKPWMETNKALVRALQLERWGMSFVMYMVILVACFSITISLVMAVKRKSREMAILRAVGIRRLDLGLIFLLHGFCVGVLGAALGVGSGLGILGLIRANVVGFVTTAYGDKPLPVLIDWGDLGMVAGGSVVLAMIAAVWPALAVMRIDVLETLSDRG